MTHDVYKKIIYVPIKIMGSEGRAWQMKLLSTRDGVAERAVFPASSSGVVCFTSYRQCAQSEICEARNSKDVNKIIVFNLNIYYRHENCAFLG
jgi:hypothetical protein